MKNTRLPVFILVLSILTAFFSGCTTPQTDGIISTATTTTTITTVTEPLMPLLPDLAGGDLMKFDIYIKEAYADIENSGRLRRVKINVKENDTVIYIDNIKYPLLVTLTSETFAIADIDPDDGMYEIILKGQSSYIFRYSNDEVVFLDDISSLSFDGENRKTLDLMSHFDGRGAYYKSTKTSFVGEVYYPGRFKLPQTGQVPLEDPYDAPVLSKDVYISLNPGHMCALLFEKDESYYSSEYNVIWDYASWPHINGREIDPEPKGIFSVITAGEEIIQIIGVYAPDWFLLKTGDGHLGYVSIRDGKIRGYDKVMYISIDDMFSPVSFP